MARVHVVHVESQLGLGRELEAPAFDLGITRRRGVVSSTARGYSSCPLGKPESAVFRGDGPRGPFVSPGKRVEKKMIRTVDRKEYNGLF